MGTQRPKPLFEEKMEKWNMEHPVMWSVGIGPAASFMPTLTRLILKRSEDQCGPYDHIIRVRLPPAAAGSSSTAHHWLAFELLMEVARTLKIPDNEVEKLKQLGAEEGYCGYGTFSKKLMLQAFGIMYARNFGSYRQGPDDEDDYRVRSPLVDRVNKELGNKRYLVLIQKLHVPISFDGLILILGKRPSALQHRRWLISSTCKAVYDESRHAISPLGDRNYMDFYRLRPEDHFAPSFDDLLEHEWVMLIRDALQDAAMSIFIALKQKRRGPLFSLEAVQQCLYYGILYHSRHGSAGHEASATAISSTSVSSDELIRCWVAEGLLVSWADPTDPPPATGNKQSSNYRSAYEAGEVVIQSLQQYSLLPIYSVSTRTTSTSTTATATSSSPLDDIITGVSKLAMTVPRLKYEELLDHEKSNRLRWVSFMNEDGRHVSSGRRDGPSSVPGEMTMSTLILRGCNVSCFPFDRVLNHCLHVLDLSYTPINSLPPCFSRLLNLHLLSLRGCTQLKTLSPPPPDFEGEVSLLAHLGNLQVLDMNGVPLLELTPQDGSNKSFLYYLDLSGSNVTTLPSEFFREMSNLEELILGKCSNLKELPPSFAELSNLLILHVEGTQITTFTKDMFHAMQRLHTLKLIDNMLLISLPRSLSLATSLKELHIYNCISLRLEFLWELVLCLEDLYIQTWKSLEVIKIHAHPNLRTFSLSGPWIRCLSLCGCSKLKVVNFSDDLTAMEDVDLSATALEEVPHNLPNLPQLKMLLLLNVPCFTRFPWHKLVRFPKVFCLDHYAGDHNQLLKMSCQYEICADENQIREKTTNIAQINLNDSRIFHSFNADAANKLVKEGQFLQSFNIQVKPCSVRGMKAKNKEGDLCIKIQRRSPYPDVCNSEAASILPMKELQPRQRHVHLSAKNRHPNGLMHLLSVANSVFITDDAFVRCLTYLSPNLIFLEECQLQHCDQMTEVFRMESKISGELGALPSLRILQASCLKNVMCIVRPVLPGLGGYKLITLKLLKHIHLEHCPRLEELFPSNLSLPALEILVILFCSKLKTIFYKEPKVEVEPSPLPNIKQIYLQELPQLLHIHDDILFQFETPKWDKLFVRGCQSFHHLPLLKMQLPKSKVEVSGEREWWHNLQMLPLKQCDYYLHVPPPELVSRKKHIIESYLR